MKSPRTSRRFEAIQSLSGSKRASGRRKPHLFAGWPGIVERLRGAKRLALFLDFDGTLAPLCRRPEETRLDASTRSLIRRLALRRNVILSVISGRPLGDLKGRVNVRGVLYLGLHGWQWAAGRSLNGAQQKALDGARCLLAARFARLADVWIEDKQFSFAVHYRGAANGTIEQARAVLRHTLQPFASRTEDSPWS